MIEECVKPECEDWVMGNTTLKIDESFLCAQILTGVFLYIQNLTGDFLYTQKNTCKILCKKFYTKNHRYFFVYTKNPL